MATNDSVITTQLYSKIEKSLKDKDILSKYKTNIDKFLADNMEIYFAAGPGRRPIYSEQRIAEYIQLLGLTPQELDNAVKDSKNLKSTWFMLKPYNVANAMATRFFGLAKNEDYLNLTFSYLIVVLYPPLHQRYFKYNVNESCMDYTLNNLSNRYGIKKTNTLWALLLDTVKGAYENDKDKILAGTDKGYLAYLQSAQTRLNSILKNIANAYYDNWENQRFLKTEHESFEEDSYYEADSNTFAIDRISNKVTTALVINGPDAKLVQLAAQMNKVSVNQLRNFTDAMIVDKKTNEIHAIVEAILFLYLFNDDGNLHSPEQVKTNDFMVYCLQIYRRSNTTDKNIIKIKKILDGWLDEVGLTGKTSRTATIIGFRKALFTFFVMEIQQNA